MAFYFVFVDHGLPAIHALTHHLTGAVWAMM